MSDQVLSAGQRLPHVIKEDLKPSRELKTLLPIPDGPHRGTWKSALPHPGHRLPPTRTRMNQYRIFGIRVAYGSKEYATYLI